MDDAESPICCVCIEPIIEDYRILVCSICKQPGSRYSGPEGSACHYHCFEKYKRYMGFPPRMNTGISCARLGIPANYPPSVPGLEKCRGTVTAYKDIILSKAKVSGSAKGKNKPSNVKAPTLGQPAHSVKRMPPSANSELFDPFKKRSLAAGGGGGGWSLGELEILIEALLN